MYEAEFSMWVLASQFAIALHRCPTIRADVDHSDPIQDATIVLGVCVQSLDHEPLIRMSSAHLRPEHVFTLRADRGLEQLLDSDGECAAGALDIDEVTYRKHG